MQTTIIKIVIIFFLCLNYLQGDTKTCNIDSFLNSLQSKKRELAFNIEDTPNWKPDFFNKYISDDGLKINDVNYLSQDVVYNKTKIENELHLKQGRSYVFFSHLSYLYTNFFKRDIYIVKKEVIDNKLKVTFDIFYILSFKLEKDNCKLYESSYEVFESE
jgi:hypothetical protein